ncbi:hypothetical protein DYB32_006122 [Aphanomyces invadans]|uniref:Serine protease n=1 Tax=Aphanomyces invadans TaxID=157072 RepID=A0A3R6YX29_9STRA|nr:hypothetical protein DYB32_006122 [Aphanomyces invadans]
MALAVSVATALRAVTLPATYRFDGADNVEQVPLVDPVWTSPPIFQSDAVSITLQLSSLSLPSNSYVLLRPLAATENPTNASTFFPSGAHYANITLPRVYTNYLVVEIYAMDRHVQFSVVHSLQVVAFTYITNDDLVAQTQALGRREALCGTDDSVHAVCTYTPLGATDTMYAHARPVVRITVDPTNPFGTDLCTGWLWGSDGHVITNNHCIGSVAEATTAQFEFVAETFDCDASMRSTCPGSIEVMSAKLVFTNPALDYTLLKLDAAVAQKYGFLQTTEVPAGVGMPVYAHANVVGTLGSCEGKGGLRYNADTDGGSSGSPVISATDHSVVALHYCGASSCNNAGIPMVAIVADLKKRGFQLPLNAIAVPKSTAAAGVIPPFNDPRVNPRPPLGLFGSPIAFNGVLRRLGTSTRSFQTTVDQYEITLDGPGQVAVDILSYEIDEVANAYADLNNDCRFNFFDSNVYVYSRDPTVPRYNAYFNDDVDWMLRPSDGRADGSVSKKDSYLVATLPKGTHIVAVGVSNLSLKNAGESVNEYRWAALESCVGENPSPKAEGTYRITLTSTVGLTVGKTPSVPTTPPPRCTMDLAQLQANCANEQQAYFLQFMNSFRR